MVSQAGGMAPPEPTVGHVGEAGDGVFFGHSSHRTLPELVDDLIAEILLRLKPGDPSCLVRASLVCKSWRRLVSDPAFRRRYRGFHRARLRVVCDAIEWRQIVS